MNNRSKISKLIRMSIAFQNLNKSAELKLGISLVQYHLLVSIKDLPGSAPQVIAKEVGIHPSSLTQGLKRLSKRGYLYVDSDPRDSRKKIVSLTLDGMKAIALFEAKIEDILNIDRTELFAD